MRRLWQIPNAKDTGLEPNRLRWIDGAYTVMGIIEAVGTSKKTVHKWLKQGFITGRRSGSSGLWRIPLTVEMIDSLRERVRRGTQ
jgi:hypothetical protein